MRDLVFREGDAGDARAIAEIHVRGWQWAYRGMLPDDLLARLAVDSRAAFWRQWLVERAPDRHLWLALCETRPVGFAAGASRDVAASSDTAELYALYLEADVVELGIGRALCSHAMDRLVSAGFRTATLWVLAANARARRFYERTGWCADGAARTEDWHGVPLHEVRYARDLRGLR
jgi:ribosomal protein S18 acetylase RimI-like enzyme